MEAFCQERAKIPYRRNKILRALSRRHHDSAVEIGAGLEVADALNLNTFSAHLLARLFFSIVKTFLHGQGISGRLSKTVVKDPEFLQG